MLYLIISLVIYFVGAYSIRNNIYRSGLLFCFISIVLFWGLGYSYTPDVGIYMDYFNNVVPTINQSINLSFYYFEPGFNLLAIICKSITPHFIIFQFVIFLIDMTLVVKGIQKLFREEWHILFLCSLLFEFSMLLSATRQGIAIAIFIFALHYLIEKKTIKYLLCILCAFFFHHSSLILISVIFAPFFKRLLESRIFLIGLLLVVDLFWFQDFNLASLFDNSFLSLFFSRTDLLDYSRYIEGLSEAESAFGIAKIIEINITYILFLIFIKNRDIYFSFCLVFFVIVGLLLGGIVAHRILYYFNFIYYFCFVMGMLYLFSEIANKKPITSFVVIGIYKIVFFIFISQLINRNYILCPDMPLLQSFK